MRSPPAVRDEVIGECHPSRVSWGICKPSILVSQLHAKIWVVPKSQDIICPSLVWPSWPAVLSVRIAYAFSAGGLYHQELCPSVILLVHGLCSKGPLPLALFCHPIIDAVASHCLSSLMCSKSQPFHEIHFTIVIVWEPLPAQHRSQHLLLCRSYLGFHFSCQSPRA